MKTTKLLAAFCCALGMVSCSNDDILSSDMTNEATPTSQMIGFSASVFDEEPQSRAIVTQSNFKSQSAVVKVFRGDTHQTDLTLSYTSGKWTPSIKTPWYSNSTYKFYSAMPIETPLSEDGNRILDIPGFIPAEEGTDYLYAAPLTTTSSYGMSRGVNLTFLHVYNKFKIKFAPIGEEYKDFKIRVNSAKIWLAKDRTDWDNQVGAMYATNSPAIMTVTADQVTTDAFNEYDLGNGITDEMEASQEFLMLSPAVWNANNTTYMYLDVDYDIVDADGNAISSYSVSKQSIKIDIGTSVFNNCVRGSRSITINVSMSMTGKIKYMQFDAELEDWHEIDKNITTP